MARVPKLLWLVAIALLLAATMNLPYGYYTLLRIVICGFSAVVATFGFIEKSNGWATAFALLAVLFNPVIPVYLNRQDWFWFDIGAAVMIAAHLGYLLLAGVCGLFLRVMPCRIRKRRSVPSPNTSPFWARLRRSCAPPLDADRDVAALADDLIPASPQFDKRG
ncbi:DUF6804 family protein [Bradyrhizobium zhanjiangense]|uniref:Integral membrane protein n=1 Tax=Bradyrhizobium zhanjiangense TaxID=1325107 RepID=A0ABY0DQB2_9BRAD|nr:DUF6804 family protein [Bradyrhizobium zhanjiangense]RXG96373.1 hypothetical protein EAS62_12355 [Bradyrhizobium zhanjiangense]